MHTDTGIQIHACMHTIMYIILGNCNVLELTEKMPGKWCYSPLPDTKKYVSVCSPRWLVCIV